ncbi:MAG: hypothetical protein OEV73_01870 [Desulfobulbaceae bacterium]|nr:hypothetical protein [Desulfobulbaceae bacterium]
MILSIDESIQRLKAEILAQDWRLSPRRLESIEAAFACLKTRFNTRKGMLAILAMAESVVVYMKKREETPPATIDFLKETMAHIVSLYEERDYNPEHEEELFRRIFKRYNSLKQKVQDSRERPPAETDGRQEAAAPPAPADTETAPPGLPAEPTKASYATEQLLSRLRLILSRKDGSTIALQRFLEETVVLAGDGEPITTGRLRAILDQMTKQPPDAAVAPSERPVSGGSQKQYEAVACEETPVRRLVIGTTQLLVPEEQIALIRPLKAGKLSSYLHTGRIGLADFSRMMQGLAGQFCGPLAAMKDRQLKKLALPVITPQGLGLPELPDEQASGVLVLSHDNWHGAVFCSAIADEASAMVKFRKGKNGDIAGTAWLLDGDSLPLLNVAEFLRREGFLTMVAE